MRLFVVILMILASGCSGSGPPDPVVETEDASQGNLTIAQRGTLLLGTPAAGGHPCGDLLPGFATAAFDLELAAPASGASLEAVRFVARHHADGVVVAWRQWEVTDPAGRTVSSEERGQATGIGAMVGGGFAMDDEPLWGTYHVVGRSCAATSHDFDFRAIASYVT